LGLPLRDLVARCRLAPNGGSVLLLVLERTDLSRAKVEILSGAVAELVGRWPDTERARNVADAIAPYVVSCLVDIGTCSDPGALFSAPAVRSAILRTTQRKLFERCTIRTWGNNC